MNTDRLMDYWSSVKEKVKRNALDKAYSSFKY